MTTRVLVAGIGNIFLGDDAFGTEVASRLVAAASLPEGVKVVDYGIRGFDLAFALLDDHEAVVLIDAMARGETPGTVFLVEADLDDTGPDPGAADGGFQGHTMTPGAVFALVRSLGGRPRRVLVVGCEPASFGPEDEGRMGLSPAVEAAVPEAMAMVERVVADLLAAPAPVTAGTVEAADGAVAAGGAHGA